MEGRCCCCPAFGSAIICPGKKDSGIKCSPNIFLSGKKVKNIVLFDFIKNSNYKFYKKWSNSKYRGYLELDDGRRIENTNKIDEYRKDLFNYGKSTYNNIVFSSQQDIKSTLERINAQKNPELIDTINSFLRRAVMELDGISVDKFRQKIETELEELTKKWDLTTDAVSNSDRGINNPYQKGTGKIYDIYIAKEKLRKKIKQSKINDDSLAVTLKKCLTAHWINFRPRQIPKILA